MASVRPRESARPSPTPVVLSVSPSRWNGRNTRSRCVGRDAGSAVDDRGLDAVAEADSAGQARRVRPAGSSAARWPPGWPAPAPAGRGRPAPAAGRRQVHDHVARRRRRGRRARGRPPRRAATGWIVDGQRPGLQAAHVEQVVDQAGEPVQRLVGGLPAARRGPRRRARGRRCAGVETDGLGGRQRGAQVVADGGEQRRADLVRPRPAVAASAAGLAAAGSGPGRPRPARRRRPTRRWSSASSRRPCRASTRPSPAGDVGLGARPGRAARRPGAAATCRATVVAPFARAASTEVEPEGLRGPARASRSERVARRRARCRPGWPACADSAAARAACRVRRAARSTTELTSIATRTKTTSARALLGLLMRQGVQRRGEVVVEQHRPDDRRDQGRAQAADQRDDHREQQEQQHVADQVERRRAPGSAPASSSGGSTTAST